MPGEQELLSEMFRKVSSGSSVHDAPLKLRAKNGDTKNFIIDTNANFNKDGSFGHTRYTFYC